MVALYAHYKIINPYAGPKQQKGNEYTYEILLLTAKQK